MFEQFAERMKKRRNDKNLTLRDLAQLVGTSATYLSALERGINAPGLENAIKIANVLEVPLIWLLGDDEINKSMPILEGEIKNKDTYEVFLDTHIFPNKMTYREMEEQLKKFEQLKKMLGETLK